MEENPLNFAEKRDKVLLFQTIHCFYNYYGRYFKDSAEKWWEINKEKKEKDRLKKVPEGMMKEDSTRSVIPNNLIEKEKEEIISNLILKDY
jgi:hypothetical protein